MSTPSGAAQTGDVLRGPDGAERVTVFQRVPIELWRDIVAPDAIWDSLRSEAAAIAAERPGWTLASLPSVAKDARYGRIVDTEDGPRERDCAEDEAEFAMLRLVVWAQLAASDE